MVCKSTLIGETACANLQSCGGETLGRHSSTSALKLPLQCDCEDLYDWDNIVGLSSAAFSNPGHRKRALSLQTGRDNALLIQGYSDTFLNQLKYFLQDAFDHILANCRCFSRGMVKVNDT